MNKGSSAKWFFIGLGACAIVFIAGAVVGYMDCAKGVGSDACKANRAGTQVSP